MAIEQRQITLYRVKCDQCGKRGPESRDEEMAQMLAYDHDWHEVTKRDGQEYVKKDLCPVCFMEWEVLKAEDPEQYRDEQLGQAWR